MNKTKQNKQKQKTKTKVSKMIQVKNKKNASTLVEITIGKCNFKENTHKAKP